MTPVPSTVSHQLFCFVDQGRGQAFHTRTVPMAVSVSQSSAPLGAFAVSVFSSEADEATFTSRFVKGQMRRVESSGYGDGAPDVLGV